jgi:hypothetical protein
VNSFKQLKACEFTKGKQTSLTSKEKTHMANGGDIIIKGGSVAVIYDEGVYLQDSADRKKHSNAAKKITRIVISGDLTYDSGEFPEGLSCEIKAVCS